MEVNIESFKNLLSKATLDYSLDTVGFTVNPEEIKCGMKGDNYVIILNMKNDLIPDIKGECEFYFSEPRNQIKTHLDLMNSNDSVEIEINDLNIILKSEGQRSIIHYCSPNRVPTFTGMGPRIQGDTLYNVKLDDDWMFKYDKIQKIANKFKKIYFVVKDKELYIDATDKLNDFSNGLSTTIGTCDHDDIVLCFDFKAFSNTFRVLGEDYSDFTMNVSTLGKIENAGLISFLNDDGSEKYYILSKEDTE